MQKITPCLWFNGRAEEAANFYVSLFKNSRIVSASPMMVVFELDGLQIQLLNGGPTFTLNEAFSLSVSCADQAEVDRLWNALIADGGAESQCAWLKDRFGVSWQIVPARLGQLMSDPDKEKAGRVMQAMLQMKKIDIAGLERAYAG